MREMQAQSRHTAAKTGEMPNTGPLPSTAEEYVSLKIPEVPKKAETPEIEVSAEKRQELEKQVSAFSEPYQNWNAGSDSVLGLPDRPSADLKRYLTRNLSGVLDVDPKNVSVRYEERFRTATLFIDVTREDGKIETLTLELERTRGKISGISQIEQSVRAPTEGTAPEEQRRRLGYTLDEIGYLSKPTLRRWNGVETAELRREKAQLAEVYKAAFNAPPMAEVQITAQADGSYQGRIELQGREIASFTHDKEFSDSEVLTLSDTRGIERGRRALSTFDVRLHGDLSDAVLRDYGVSLRQGGSFAFQLDHVNERNRASSLPLPEGTERIEFSRAETDLKIQFIGKDQTVLDSVLIGANRSRK